MSARLLATVLATGTALGAGGASAQQIYYEDGDYLYAVPAQSAPMPVPVPLPLPDSLPIAEPLFADPPADTESTAAIVLPIFPEGDGNPPVFAYDPVVQPVAPQIASQGAVRSIPVRADQVARDSGYPAAAYPTYQGAYAYGAAPQSGYLPGGGQLVSFDRNVWIAECQARLATYEDTDRAQIIGTLVGAAAGGLIGNRVAGRGDRLGGTLIGAGTGALAGSVVGDAIDDRTDARSYAAGDGGYCAAYLDDYIERASRGAVATTTVPGQQYFLVPVTVSIAQKPVYSD